MSISSVDIILSRMTGKLDIDDADRLSEDRITPDTIGIYTNIRSRSGKSLIESTDITTYKREGYGAPRKEKLHTSAGIISAYFLLYPTALFTKALFLATKASIPAILDSRFAFNSRWNQWQLSSTPSFGPLFTTTCTQFMVWPLIALTRC